MLPSTSISKLFTLLPMSRSQVRARLFFCCIVFISACSLKTVYNQLDSLIPSYVEGMVSLDDMLEDKVEQRTQLLLNWHRNTQLRQYAELLKTFQQDIEKPLTEQRVLDHLLSIQQLWHTLENRINEDMAQLLPLLNKQQQDELFDNISDKNDDFHDDYVDIDDDERLENYIENISDSFESSFDDLSEEQTQLINQSATRLQSTAQLRLQRMLSWQSNIKNILQKDLSTEKKTAELKMFFDDFVKNKPEKLEVIDTSNRKTLAQLTVAITNTLSSEQRAFFKQKSDNYIKILTELAENR